MNLDRVLGLLLALVGSLTLWMGAAPIAHADGGAPNLAYVAGAGSGVGIIDIGQQKISPSFHIDGGPKALYLTLDGRFLFVAQAARGRVAMLAAKTGQEICAASVQGHPSLLSFDPGLNILYAAANDSNIISVIDPKDCALKRTIKVTGSVYGLAVAVVGSDISGGNGNQLWVSDSTNLTIYDGQGKTLASVPIPGGPQYITIPLGSTVYVNTRQGTVVAVDLGTRQVSTPLMSGGKFGPMDYDAISGDIYVPDSLHNRVDVLTPMVPGSKLPREPGSTINLGVAPLSIAITSDGAFGFIALTGGNVAMLDIPAKQIINTFFVGGSPTFIITGLYAPLIGTTPQQANIWETIFSIGAYILVVAIILVPMFFLWRYNRQRSAAAQPQAKPEPPE